MAYRCNGKGCGSAWNCDECRQTGDCDKYVECDFCGKELYEHYFNIEGEHLCEDCLETMYGRIV